MPLGLRRRAVGLALWALLACVGAANARAAGQVPIFFPPTWRADAVEALSRMARDEGYRVRTIDGHRVVFVPSNTRLVTAVPPGGTPGLFQGSRAYPALGIRSGDPRAFYCLGGLGGGNYDNGTMSNVKGAHLKQTTAGAVITRETIAYFDPELQASANWKGRAPLVMQEVRDVITARSRINIHTNIGALPQHYDLGNAPTTSMRLRPSILVRTRSEWMPMPNPQPAATGWSLSRVRRESVGAGVHGAAQGALNAYALSQLERLCATNAHRFAQQEENAMRALGFRDYTTTRNGVTVGGSYYSGRFTVHVRLSDGYEYANGVRLSPEESRHRARQRQWEREHPGQNYWASDDVGCGSNLQLHAAPPPPKKPWHQRNAFKDIGLWFGWCATDGG